MGNDGVIVQFDIFKTQYFVNLDITGELQERTTSDGIDSDFYQAFKRVLLGTDIVPILS